jgi:dienelactone hydrolase
LQEAARPAEEQPRFVAPSTALHDDDVRLSVAGLVPGAAYDLRAELASRAGTVWRSNARFIANERGLIDPATMAPESGSYQGIDAIGMFWSMVNTQERQTDASRFETDDQTVVTFEVRQGEKAIADHWLTLGKRAIGVSSTEIRDPFVGTFLVPYGKQRLPAVIVLGGSEGGLSRDRAALLASHGYAALALAYFGMDPLPQELDRIPVEYVDRAIDWLRRQPAVDPTRLAILGVSKGAELALLSAARNPTVNAIVAVAPSSVAFQSINRARSTSSSWTVAGKDVPFTPYVASEKYRQSRKLIDLYEASLAAAPPEAEIPVERIRGPILLLAGKDDALWPSAAMSERIAERARRNEFSHPVKSFIFENAGHHACHLALRPTADSVRLGGTAQGLAAAQVACWDRIVEFLEASLPTPSRGSSPAPSK